MIRVGQRLGKYRIKRRLAAGGFADVFAAYDTIEKVPLALKVPYAKPTGKELPVEAEREIRIHARLDHPNVLALKNADVIDGRLVLAYPMGVGSLADRMQHRVSVRNALAFGEQLLEALAHAHERRLVHCDVKPENLILFDDGSLRLSDFGLAKEGVRTLNASSSGTVGYCAPEQAMGRPSKRSDVFSAGLVIYRLLAGVLPEWPFEWPPPRILRVRRNAGELVLVLQRALQPDARRRFQDAGAMLEAFVAARKAIEKRLDLRKRGGR